MTNILLQQAASANLQDQTIVKTFVARIPDAGKGVARFIGYVEAGERPTMYQGKPNGKKAMKAYLFFELNGPRHQFEADNGPILRDGKKYDTMLYRINAEIKLSDKAIFRKLFMKMRNGREAITHMSQMLGESFIIGIEHNKSGEGEAAKTYANMRTKDGEWMIYPPQIEDPLSGNITRVPVPEPTKPYSLLLWDNPSKEQWESIFIDGTTTRKNDKGEEVEVSKNWIQNEIVKSAINFEDSAVYAMLAGIGGLTLDGDAVDDSGAAEDNLDHDPVQEQPKEPEVKEEPKAPVEQEVQKPKEPEPEVKKPVVQEAPPEDDEVAKALRELGIV